MDRIDDLNVEVQDEPHSQEENDNQSDREAITTKEKFYDGLARLKLIKYSTWGKIILLILLASAMVSCIVISTMALADLQRSLCSLSKENNALKSAQRHHLGKHFISHMQTFKNDTYMFIQRHYEDLIILLDSVENLSISYDEYEIMSTQTLHLNIISSILSYMLDMPASSNRCVMIGSITTGIMVYMSTDYIVYSFFISLVVCGFSLFAYCHNLQFHIISENKKKNQ